MTNLYTNFWENIFTDMIEKNNQLFQNNPFMSANSFFDDAFTKFKEFSETMQKLSGWDFILNSNDNSDSESGSFFDQVLNPEGFSRIFEESVSRLKELSSYSESFKTLPFFMNPTDFMNMDFRKNSDEFFKFMGLISIDEYQSLIKKYEELKKQSSNSEKIQNEQAQKISELNQTAAAEKRKATSREKTANESKAKLDEQKKANADLTKELESQKKHTASLEKELNELKTQNEKLKKELNEQKSPKEKN